MNFKREIVEKDGIKSYFFPTLLFNIIGNEEAICKCSKDVNPVSAFITGLSPDQPTEEQLYDLITAQNNDAESISTSMDTLFALGPKQAAKFNELGLKLKANSCQHDIFELQIANEKNFESAFGAFLRKCTIQRREDTAFLTLLFKLRFTPDAFDIPNLLMQHGLTFDAFVLMKLNVIPGTEEEIEEFRKVAFENLQLTHPKLWDRLNNLPVQDDSQLFDTLIAQPISEIFEKAIALIVEKFNGVDETSETRWDQVSSTTSSFFYLTLRSLISNERALTAHICSALPGNFKNHALTELETHVFEVATYLAQFFIGVFGASFLKSNNSTFITNDLITSRLYDILATEWKREALSRVLNKFKWSVSQHPQKPLCPELNESADNIYEAVVNGLEFALWSVENYGKETTPIAVSRLHYIDSKAKRSFTMHLEVGSNTDERVVQHFRQIREAVDKITTGDVKSERRVTFPSTHETARLEQALEEAHLKKLQYSKDKIQAIHELTPSSKDVTNLVMRGIDQTDSNSLLNVQSKDIGNGVTAFAYDPLKSLTKAQRDEYLASFALSPAELFAKQAKKLENPAVKELKTTVGDDSLSSDGWESPLKTPSRTDITSHNEDAQVASQTSFTANGNNQLVSETSLLTQPEDNQPTSQTSLLTQPEEKQFTSQTSLLTQNDTSELAQVPISGFKTSPNQENEQPKQLASGDSEIFYLRQRKMVNEMGDFGSGGLQFGGAGDSPNRGGGALGDASKGIYDSPPSTTFQAAGGFSQASFGFSKAAKAGTGGPDGGRPGGAGGFGAGSGFGGSNRGSYRGGPGSNPYRGNSGSFGQGRGRGGGGGSRF